MLIFNLVVYWIQLIYLYVCFWYLIIIKFFYCNTFLYFLCLKFTMSIDTIVLNSIYFIAIIRLLWSIFLCFLSPKEIIFYLVLFVHSSIICVSFFFFYFFSDNFIPHFVFQTSLFSVHLFNCSYLRLCNNSKIFPVTLYNFWLFQINLFFYRYFLDFFTYINFYNRYSIWYHRFKTTCRYT